MTRSIYPTHGCRGKLNWTLALAILGTVTGCGAPVPSVNEPCPMEQLLLEVPDFPGGGWEETGLRSYRGAPLLLGIDRSGTSFSTLSRGGAGQDVYLFASTQEAIEGAEELEEAWLLLVSSRGTCQESSSPADFGVSADQTLLRCCTEAGDPQPVETCVYIARYRTYVVRLYADMIALSRQDLSSLAEEIDMRMVACLPEEQPSE